MTTSESTEVTETEETVEVPEAPDRPNGVTNEQWSEFMTKFDAFAERIEKGLTAKRPTAPKASTQQVTKPSVKPEAKTAPNPPKEDAPEKPKKKRGYWG